MNGFLTLFARALKLARAESDRLMSRHGVRVGQSLILEHLWIHDGQTPGELAGRIGVSTPTIVNSARRMVEGGLIERRPDAADRRLVRLWLTTHAWQLREAFEAERDGLADRILGAVEPNDREALIRALQAIVTELSRDDARD